MKTIFDRSTFDELLERLDRLGPRSERQWGKMSAAQMIEHVVLVMEMASGKTPGKQEFLGKAIGWIFKSNFLGEKPFPQNAPAGTRHTVTDDPDFEVAKARLKDLANDFHALGESGTDGNVHDFFGPLTGKQWGETQYKHLDHHLRQFGV